MKLFQINADNETLFVMAKDMIDAIKRWREWIVEDAVLSQEAKAVIGASWPEGVTHKRICNIFHVPSRANHKTHEATPSEGHICRRLGDYPLGLARTQRP